MFHTLENVLMAKMGRPKKTPENSFPVGWEDHILALGAEGASDVEIYNYLDICYETFCRLLREDDHFSKTVKKARRLCEAWWQKNGRENIKNKEFNSTLWYMNMKNRFGWCDRREQKIDHTSKGESIQKIERVIVKGGDA